jgi:hypothetical protein
MAASTNVTFWSFVWYLVNNPDKKELNKQDIIKAARVFAATNSDEVTTGTDPGGTYTDIEWPGANGVTAVGNSTTHTDPTVLSATKTGIIDWEFVNLASQVTLDQAAYPETLLAGE